MSSEKKKRHSFLKFILILILILILIVMFIFLIFKSVEWIKKYKYEKLVKTSTRVMANEKIELTEELINEDFYGVPTTYNACFF